MEAPTKQLTLESPEDASYNAELQGIVKLR